MPILNIRVFRAEPLFEGCAKPTVQFEGEISNSGGEYVHCAMLLANVSLTGKRPIYICSVPIFRSQISPNSPSSFTFTVGFDIDTNNAIHQLFKETAEEVSFYITFSGTVLYGQNGQPIHNASQVPSDNPQTVGLAIEKYKRLLSTYYKDISWIAISRDTSSELRQIADKEGFTTTDELIRSLLNKTGRSSK